MKENVLSRLPSRYVHLVSKRYFVPVFFSNMSRKHTFSRELFKLVEAWRKQIQNDNHIYMWSSCERVGKCCLIPEVDRKGQTKPLCIAHLQEKVYNMRYFESFVFLLYILKKTTDKKTGRMSWLAKILQITLYYLFWTQWHKRGKNVVFDIFSSKLNEKDPSFSKSPFEISQSLFRFEICGKTFFMN